MRWLSWVFGVAALAISVGAASAQGLRWQVQTVGQVKPGGQASVTVGVDQDVKRVVLALTSDRGAKKRFTVKRLRAGQTKTFRWRARKGVTLWAGALSGQTPEGTSTAQIEMQVVALGPFDVKLSKADVFLKEGLVVIIPNRGVAKAELVGFGDGGVKLIDEEIELDGATGRVEVRFEPPELPLRRVELKLYDPYGFWAALRIAQWYAEIPHKDVVFATGTAEVTAEEAPKVTKAISLVNEELARYRKELGDEAATIDAKVYVAGYTDTVGSAGDNRRLSLARAKAIARYFRDQGLKLPIYYQGFGEAALAQPTEDNVDEAKNRRATYVVANVAPRGGDFPNARWIKLK